MKISANIELKDHGYQVHNMGATEYGYHVKNAGNMETTDYGYNLVNELFLPDEVVKKSDYEALQIAHEEKVKDYEAVKKQYAKVASDYANLHNYVTELQTQNANLKNDLKTEKLNGRDGRKMISTLKNTNQTLTEHLCLFACVIEGRSELGKEIRRLIKKYCKKSNSGCKKNVEESFENQSVDTGRGSSLASSDAERSFDSPAYSINFSPLSTCSRNEQTKVMRDASSSTKVKTSDISTSPIIFKEAPPGIKTFDVSTSPINFTDMRTAEAKRNTLDIATSPIQFADTRTPVAKAKTLNIATSPIEFADTTTPVAKAKTLNIATSPIEFADTSTPVAKAKTLNIATSPIKFADTRTKAKTLSIATSPIEFADKRTPVAKAKTLNIATSPIEFADTSTPVAKTKTLSIATSPIKFADTRTPVAKTKTLQITNCPKTENLLPINSVASNWNTYPIEESPLSVTKHTDYKTSSLESTTCHENEITEKLKEIVSQHLDQSQDDAENDSEVQMILLKQRLNWDMLSPMSLTPEVDQENELTQSESKERKDKTKEQSSITDKQSEICEELVQSMHISGDEQSEDEIDREDCHFSILSIEDPQQVTSDVVFDLLKNRSAVENDQYDSIQKRNLTSHLEDIVPEPSNQISNRSPTNSKKTHVTSTKYKKLTNLQKIYKANIRKSKIKRQVSPVKKQQVRPRPYSISPIKYSVASLTHKEKLRKLPEMNTKKTLFKKQNAVVEVCKENSKFSFKEPQPLPYCPKRSQTKLKSNIEYGFPHIQTNPQSESDQKQGVCLSQNNTEKYSNSIRGVPHTQTNLLLEAGPKNRACMSTETQSNSISGYPHTQTNLLPESDAKQRVCVSTETQSNSISGVCHTQSNLLPKSEPEQRVCVSTETQSNSLSGVSHTQTNLLPKSKTEQRDCVSTEAQSNSISEVPHTQTNLLPESGRKKRICMSIERQSNSRNKLSQPQLNQVPDSGPSLGISSELISECNQTSYSKPSKIRIARVRKSISTNPPVLSSKQSDNNNSNEGKSCTSDDISHNNYDDCKSPPSKRNKVTNDLNINDALDIEKTRSPSVQQVNTAERIANIDNCKIDTSEIINDCVVNNENGSNNDQHSSSLIIGKAVVPRPDDSNIHPITQSTPSDQTRHYADYNDMNMFTAQNECSNIEQQKDKTDEWRQNIMDNDAVVAKKIETGIGKCVKSSKKEDDYVKASDELVNELKKLGSKRIISGLMKYLNDPARKADFIPAKNIQKGYCFGPTVTPTEMALIDVIVLLEKSGITLWKPILASCEYTLFTLEKGATPVFEVVESVAHFYVNICKFQGNVSGLWMFMLNAMYCLSFKAIPLIKHCLDVVPRYAPMIRCLVFLLHFYNCDDRFKRVQDLRLILRNKYHYNLQDENETTILFLLKTKTTGNRYAGVIFNHCGQKTRNKMVS
ncbi:putative inner membrane protein [Operophtera brumata]|uniref:Putative inner membrane protein n=1 Tax=Operophtera brumata TaxID=104452 RepID=A0A0L7LLX8_OPEBR|nr:putative inner membrane protein [Operophtera brumata]